MSLNIETLQCATWTHKTWSYTTHLWRAGGAGSRWADHALLDEVEAGWYWRQTQMLNTCMICYGFPALVYRRRAGRHNGGVLELCTLQRENETKRARKRERAAKRARERERKRESYFNNPIRKTQLLLQPKHNKNGHHQFQNNYKMPFLFFNFTVSYPVQNHRRDSI